MLVLQDRPEGYILSYFYKLPIGPYLFPECLLNFLSNFHVPPCVEKIFKFMQFTFLENVLIGNIFIHAPPHLKLSPKFLSSRPRQHSFKNLFPPTAKRGGENYDLL